MTAQLIDGKSIAATLDEKVAEETANFKKRVGRAPGLAAVLVGADPASEIYVRNKVRRTQKAGLESFEHRLSAETEEAELLALVDRLNQDEAVDGILVQLPLPSQIDSARVLNAISPEKDVDGFHPVNAGRLATGLQALVPCTPLGCLIMAERQFEKIDGVESVVVGRSNIVGKPMVQLLISRRATVTVVHSATADISAHTRRADLLVVAAGRPKLIGGDQIKPGGVVIDVGINRLDNGKIVGDVAFDEAKEVARAITPVPGGVGPMTIACLLVNTLTAACRRKGLADPACTPRIIATR